MDTVPSTGALTLLTRSSVIPRSRKPDGEAKKIQNTSKIKLQEGKVVKLSIKSRNKKKRSSYARRESEYALVCTSPRNSVQIILSR